MNSFYTIVSIDPLMVCCGDAEQKDKHVYLTLPSEDALIALRQLNYNPPKDPAKFALKLLTLFISEEELGQSNCTWAEGRKLIDQKILLGIKCKLVSDNNNYANTVYLSHLDHTNYKFPIAASACEEAIRWHKIVTNSLNAKCRSIRRKLKLKKEKDCHFLQHE